MDFFNVDPNITRQSVVADESQMFIDFINKLEGWKTKCKNLHWAAPHKNIHEYLDDFLGVLSDYQDGLAEEIMGITKQFAPNVIAGVPCSCLNATDFIITVKDGALSFYESIPVSREYAGVKSECETFLHNIYKYKYLFSLCER